jgi:putative membrane protein
MREQINTAAKGMAMGIAEVIPGVSGGTIAFITGIYQRLLSAINSINLSLISLFKKDGFKGVWQAIDGTFLFSLFIGMGMGIVGGIFTVAKLLETHPEPLWGFFFGLILASVLVLRKEITNLNINALVAFLLGIVVAVMITTLTPKEGSTSLFYVFICGAIAICALMLPGISGSFMLLILGMYTFIITTLKNVLVYQSMSDILVIAVFAVGCLTGVMSFSRVLTWLFKKFPELTMATMIGFLVGSVYKIWPWRNITSIADKQTGKITGISDYSIFNTLNKDTYKIIGERMVLPQDYLMAPPKTLLTLGCIIAGFMLILLIDKYTGSKQPNE